MNLKAIVEANRELGALWLWTTKAARVNFEKPWELVDGTKSPIYIDCRRPISTPAFRSWFIGAFKALNDDLLSEGNDDLIATAYAGGETAGIPYGAWLAEAESTPFVYVRKTSKEYGTEGKVEGYLDPYYDAPYLLLVEDLMTSAQSKLSFIGSLKAAYPDATANVVFVLFDRLQGGAEALAKEDVRVYSLTDMRYLRAMGIKHNYFSEEEDARLGQYLAGKSWR
jgi:orotate phosphoribosyltransferase